MAKKAAKQAMTSPTPGSYKPPPPEVRFELDDGIPEGLPNVGKDVTLQVSGELVKISKDDYDHRDCISVRQPKVKLLNGKKGGKG